MLFKQFPNQNSCITMLTPSELEARAILCEHSVLQSCTDFVARPTWVTLPSLVQRAVAFPAERGGSDHTIYLLCTGADTGKPSLSFCKALLTWEVTVNETDCG